MNHDFKGNAGACNGVRVTTDTNPVTGFFYAIQVLSETTFTTFTENGLQAGSMAGIAIPAGTVLYNGLGITAYTLTSGAVRAYMGLKTA